MITKETVGRVAKVARLNLTEEELEKFSHELSSIMEAFEELKKAKAGKEPAFHPIVLRDSVRADIAEHCLTEDKALQNAEQKEGKFIKGPRAV
ncbi:MAG: Asp-tRNA(Asn)/Glu-tRNA(Gln) amidotransferase subunit GatC [Candidatus Aenigmarchaeota archaeon]|nr:Asp-tRNA(Asn)/Glu-tRNA(Gln) amidotransferase subunit GatC [Candidatus Aenigmarchaeota archaeon]